MRGQLYTVKSGAHAHERLAERTPLPREAVDLAQRTVDLLGLPPGSYHLPMRDAHGNLRGYAVFKGVPDRRGPVLATVYGVNMTPPGRNVEELIHRSRA